jgi:hypothetical protein
MHSWSDDDDDDDDDDADADADADADDGDDDGWKQRLVGEAPLTRNCMH